MSRQMRVGSGFPYSYEAIGYGPGPGAASINSLKLEATYAPRVLGRGVSDLRFLRSAPSEPSERGGLNRLNTRHS